MFRKLLDEGRAGENVGVLLRGIKREEIERGQVWLSRAPSSRTPSSNLKCKFSPKMKAAVRIRSSKATVRSSTSVLLT
ncbi:hypothetical protein ACLK17_20360 [Escherichia coli]